MKKIVLTVLAAYSFVCVLFAQSWQQVQLIPSNENSAVRESVFWGDTGVIVTGNGKIFHSENFFQSFSIDSTYSPNGFDAMNFASRKLGYITSCTVQGGMLKTSDGGNTWSPLPFGPPTGECIGENVLFLSADTGVTAWREYASYLWFTFDGGHNWSYNSTLTWKQVYKIETVQDSFIYILQTDDIPPVLKRPYLYRTSNYGINWQNTFNTHPQSVTQYADFHFIDDTTAIMVLDGAILKSKDAGFTFDTVMVSDIWQDRISYNVRAISFVGRDTGFVAYRHGVYKTFDGGDTWMKTSFAFDSLDITNNNEITFVKAVSSQKVVLGCFNGNIYKTETGGGVWSDVQETEIENQFTLYPNPATNQLTIQATNLTTGSYQITTTTGQLLLQSTITQPNFTIDVSTLPPGLYFLQLTNGQQRAVKRFVKQ